MKFKISLRKKTFRLKNITTILLAVGTTLVGILVSGSDMFDKNQHVTLLSSRTTEAKPLGIASPEGNNAAPASEPIQTEELTVETPDFLDKTQISQIEAPAEGKWVTVRMRVTSYCPCSKCCGRHSDGKTANMHKISWGDRFVAADKKFAFGTEMIIPGYNHSQPVKVIDRGRDIRGNRLDVFYNTHHTASEWGVQYLDVLVKVK